MSKNMFSANHKWVFMCVFMICVFTLTDGYSQTKTNITGEVININRHLQVAFVDISERDLSQGDVVEVQVGYQTVVYMEVYESSAVISKVGIGPIAKSNFNSKVSDLEQIRIGNVVRKIEFRDPNTQDVRSEAQQGNFVSQDPLKEKTTGDKSKNLMKISKEISHQPDENRNEIEEFKSEKRVVIEEYAEAIGEKQSCEADLTRALEKNARLENKVTILKEKLEYMQELINKNTQN